MGLKKRSGCMNGSKHINGWLHTFIVEITSDILSAPVLVDLEVLGRKVNGAESVLLQAQREYVEYLVSPITRHFLFIFFASCCSSILNAKIRRWKQWLNIGNLIFHLLDLQWKHFCLYALEDSEIYGGKKRIKIGGFYEVVWKAWIA